MSRFQLALPAKQSNQAAREIGAIRVKLAIAYANSGAQQCVVDRRPHLAATRSPRRGKNADVRQPPVALMDVLAIVGLGAIGFLIGSLVFARVGRWIVTIHEIAKDEGAASKGITLASAALLSDGPWFLIAAAVFAAYAQSEPWATPIFVGAVLAMVFFGALTAYLARKASRP